MKPEDFLTALFGDWREDQLPVFLEMLKRFQEDAARYHELRDIVCQEWIPTREQLAEVDDHVDSAQQSGIF